MLRLSQIKNVFKLRGRRSTLRHHHPYQLPTELWTEILEILVFDSFSISGNCSSDEFLNFLLGWNAGLLDYKRYPANEYKPSLAWVAINLRLVCRTWSEIISDICKRHLVYFIADDPARLTVDSGRTIMVLQIFESEISWKDYYQSAKRYPLQRNLCRLGRNVTTVILSARDEWNSTEQFIYILSDHSEYFPNLHSLSIEGYSRFSDSSLRVIGEKFPQITSLRITRCKFFGNQSYIDGYCPRLPHLKIAEFSGEGLFPLCEFPALTHLSLHGYSARSPYLGLINDHVSHLESLIDMSSRGAFIHDQWIWKRPVNLTLLGAKTLAFQEATRLILEKSIRSVKHIIIFDSTVATAHMILLILDNCKGLDRLTINTLEISSLSLQDIRIRCRTKEIELVEMAENWDFSRFDQI